MVNDSEPRYRLLDNNGTVRGSLYINGSNQVVLQEATNDNEIILRTDGAVESLDTNKSVTVTTGEATDTIHYGSNQDRANAGDNSVALGIGARAPGEDGSGGTIGSHVAVGYQAALNNTGGRVTASGYQAAQNNTGFGVTAAGYKAAETNTGNRVTASGYEAARGDGLADPTTMGDDNIGIGVSAIRNNQASGLIAIGQEAGINAQTDDQLIITDRNGNRRITMDLTNGNLNIDGTLTENASL